MPVVLQRGARQCLQRPGALSEAGEEKRVTGHFRCPPIRPGCQETGLIVPGSLPPPATGHHRQLQTTEQQQAAGSSALDRGHLASLFQGHLEQGPPWAGAFGCSPFAVCE